MELIKFQKSRLEDIGNLRQREPLQIILQMKTLREEQKFDCKDAMLTKIGRQVVCVGSVGRDGRRDKDREGGGRNERRGRQDKEGESDGIYGDVEFEKEI